MLLPAETELMRMESVCAQVEQLAMSQLTRAEINAELNKRGFVFAPPPPPDAGASDAGASGSDVASEL